MKYPDFNWLPWKEKSKAGKATKRKIQGTGTLRVNTDRMQDYLGVMAPSTAGSDAISPDVLMSAHLDGDPLPAFSLATTSCASPSRSSINSQTGSPIKKSIEFFDMNFEDLLGP